MPIPKAGPLDTCFNDNTLQPCSTSLEEQIQIPALDLLYFVHDKLHFIQTFYSTAAQPFLDILRKIDNREPPYVEPEYNPDYEEPPYVAEYTEAQDSLTVLGCSCLVMVCSVLHEYLRGDVRERG